MPLNQGCLAPVTFVLPEGSPSPPPGPSFPGHVPDTSVTRPGRVLVGCLLNPGETAAVVGGNVLTSQRVVDVVLKAS